MNSETEPLPCAHCGGDAHFMDETDEHWTIFCECGIEYSGPGRDDCVTAWNRRASLPTTGGEVVAYLAEDSEGNRGLSFKENFAMRECEPGATVTPLIRATHRPEPAQPDSVLSRQVSAWRKEVARLQDLIATATAQPDSGEGE